MQWEDLLTALCLVLVIEGIMPFVAPRAWRDGMRTMAGLDDGTLRRVGLTAMVIGAGLLLALR